MNKIFLKLKVLIKKSFFKYLIISISFFDMDDFFRHKFIIDTCRVK